MKKKIFVGRPISEKVIFKNHFWPRTGRGNQGPKLGHTLPAAKPSNPETIRMTIVYAITLGWLAGLRPQLYATFDEAAARVERLKRLGMWPGIYRVRGVWRLTFDPEVS